jgi:dinuclear metal center YbgI/SA1388 family protein
MKLEQIITAVETIAPSKLAQGWDNVGFLVGDPKRDIKRILVTIDTTNDVVREAIRFKADLILAYHPIIWDGLKRVTADGATAPIYKLIQKNIGVYSIHTSLDTVAGGVNDALAEILCLADAKPLGDFVEDPAGPQYKVITFVPADHVNKVADALYAAGAGAIGNYSRCGFMTNGVGTFLPLEGAKPSIGKKGQLERVAEVRLESVVPAGKVGQVIAALRKNHPYETPAFDVFRHYDVEGKLGLGRIGKLAKPMTIPQILKRIKTVTGAKAAGLIGPQKRLVKTAAVCAGSCGKLVFDVINRDCDLYLTGELKHHQALAAAEAGLTCICLSHTVSERFALKKVVKQLKNQLKTVTIGQSTEDKDPFTWKPI